MKIKILFFFFLIASINCFAQRADLTGLYMNGVKAEKKISCYNFDTMLIVIKLNADINKFESLEGGFYILSFDSASGKLVDENSFVGWKWDSAKKIKWDEKYISTEVVGLKKDRFSFLQRMACDNFRNGDTHLLGETNAMGGTSFKPVTEFYHIKRYCELRINVFSNNKKDTTTLCKIRYEMKNLYVTKRIKNPKYPDELIVEEPKVSEFEKCKITGERMKMTADQIRALKN